MNNIEQLLKAAEYLERREREAEHGYASSLPIYNSAQTKDHSIIITQPHSSNLDSKKTEGHRSTHNELEKCRRQYMRDCMDKLKKCVPLGSDSCKHTTLGLLTKAKAFIKALEEKERKQKMSKEELEQKNRDLKLKLERLMKVSKYRESRNERTISECSGSTVSSNSSTSYLSAASSHEANRDMISPMLRLHRKPPQISRCPRSFPKPPGEPVDVGSPLPSKFKSCSLKLTDDVDVLGSDDNNSSDGSEGGVVVTTKKLSLIH